MKMKMKLRLFVIFGGLLFCPGCDWSESANATSNSADVVIITDANFQAVVLESSGPAVVECWASWCGPCRRMEPVINELATEFKGRALVGKLDVDANPDVSERYGIDAIPALLFFRDGQLVSQEKGVVSKSSIARTLNELAR